MMCLQRFVYLDTIPESVPVRISVDSKYWLWINGVLVVREGGVKRGPNPQDSYYDSIDMSPWLKNGENIISVLVWYFGKKGFSYNPSGQTAFFLDSPSIKSLNSDIEWTGTIHPAYYIPDGETPNYRLPESNIGFDARLDIMNWQSRNNGWPEVKVLGKEGDAPWGALHHRIIPMWKDFGISEYKSVKVKEGAEADTVIAKLPYNSQVMPHMDIQAPEGMTISIASDNYRGGGAPNVRCEYITRAGQQEYENIGWMNGENIIYIIPKNVRINHLSYRETGYDADFKSNFSCSDPFLNQLYAKAGRTLYLTMRDTYMDCPDRERAQWWGDVVNESGEAFYALSRSSDLLMKKGMYELIGWQKNDGALFSPIPASNWDQELPGQMLAAIGHYGFWNYYLNTGDLNTISDLYDGAKRYLNLWQKTSDGIMENRKGGWHWGDWGDNIDKEALYNALYSLAQRGVMEMAEALGRQHDCDSIASEMAMHKNAFNNYFWNGESYRSPGYTGCTDDRVQALAVVASLADRDKYNSIIKVLEKCEHASPYMEKYVTEAYFVMGYGEQGLIRMKKRFKEMVEHPDYSTLFEGWGIGADGFGGGTSNHAWSGGGLTILSQYVAGISPLSPGYDRFKIAPNPCGLEYIKLTVPTVKGDIDYRVINKNDELIIDLKCPSSIEAEIHIPEDFSEITINGIRQENYVALKGGDWMIKARKQRQ